MEKEIKEYRIVVLKRVPPGDKWEFADGSVKWVFPSLTDALEAYYESTGDTKFYIDARMGLVECIRNEEVEKTVKRFSLYGED